MRIAIDASDDSMGDSIKSEVERRRQLCAATEGRRVDPSLIGVSEPPDIGGILDDDDHRYNGGDGGDGGVVGWGAPGDGGGGWDDDPVDDLSSKVPSKTATFGAASSVSKPIGMRGPPGLGAKASPGRPQHQTLATASTDGGLGHFKSASLEAFHARATAVCRTDAERSMMGKAVQVAVVRKGMELLGRPMTAEQVGSARIASARTSRSSFTQLLSLH
jgi:hypothetical protein